jgi:hypothetical protein
MFNSLASEHLIQDLKLTNLSLVLKTAIWFIGNIAWFLGILDRSIAALGDGYLSAIGLGQILIATFLFWCWLFLKPNWKIANQRQQSKLHISSDITDWH